MCSTSTWCAGAGQLDAVLGARPDGLALSLGVVDGRNIWRSDLEPLAEQVRAGGRGDRHRRGSPRAVVLAAAPAGRPVPGATPSTRSCGRWLSFATERLDEIHVLHEIVEDRADGVAAELDARPRRRGRRGARRPGSIAPRSRERVAAHHPGHGRPDLALRRAASAPGRRPADLPAFPTTTIGSFPQTREIRDLRQRFRRGEIDAAAYEAGLREATEACIREQESLGLDVLVHGEFERTDMVEYFGDQLDGFVTTANGWVQSYGSRCVKPPVLYGDIVRPAPMTVEWADLRGRASPTAR